jgi:hypothetical protein
MAYVHIKFRENQSSTSKVVREHTRRETNKQHSDLISPVFPLRNIKYESYSVITFLCSIIS